MKAKILKPTAVFITIILALLSCEKVLDIDIPEEEQKIVINGLLSPDSTIRVHLAKSLSVLENTGEGSFNLLGAEIKLYEDGKHIKDLQHISDGFYQADYRPKPESNYRIIASHSDLTNNAEAEVAFIGAPVINSISMETELVTEAGWTYEALVMTINFKDNPQKDNYYMIALKTQRIDEYDYGNGEIEIDTVNEFQYSINSSDIVFGNDSYMENFRFGDFSGRVFSDTYIFQENYPLKIVAGYPYDYGYESDNKSKYTVYLCSISEDFYKYVLSFHNNSYTAEDPFSEPVTVLTNVQNGLGFVAGITMTSDSIEWNPSQNHR